MKVLESVAAFQEWRNSIPHAKSVGFVPTMGALHAGHESLLAKASAENDLAVLSIYVNPTQFNQTSDFEKYPKTWEADLKAAERAGADAIFAPKDSQALYPDHYHYKMTENEFSKILCGEFRPGHFDGMLSVVLKLFMLTKPKNAYFGEKDYQQLSLVQGMIDAYFLEVNLVACPTFREASGLAMSSRNVRLTAEELAKAPLIYATLKRVPNLDEAKKILVANGFKVEYLVDQKLKSGTRRFIAAWLSDVRLIDNVAL